MPFWLLVILFIACLLFILVEVVLPGMFIGLLAFLGIVVVIFFTFKYHGILAGSTFIIFALILVPLILYHGFKRFALNKSLSKEEGFTSEIEEYINLLNKQGVAVTPLRPAGIVKIDGKKYDVVTRGEMLEKDTNVEVIEVEGNRIVVKKI